MTDSKPANEEKETRTPAPPSDDLTETHHTLATPAGEIRYTASAGRVVLREQVHEDGHFKGLEAKAEMFITAYTLDGADPTVRPVTSQDSDTHGLYEATRVASVPAEVFTPLASILATGGVASAAPNP